MEDKRLQNSCDLMLEKRELIYFFHLDIQKVQGSHYFNYNEAPLLLGHCGCCHIVIHVWGPSQSWYLRYWNEFYCFIELFLNHIYQHQYWNQTWAKDLKLNWIMRLLRIHRADQIRFHFSPKSIFSVHLPFTVVLLLDSMCKVPVAHHLRLCRHNMQCNISPNAQKLSVNCLALYLEVMNFTVLCFILFLPTVTASWGATWTCLNCLGRGGSLMWSDAHVVPHSSCPLGMFYPGKNVPLSPEFQSNNSQFCDILSLTADSIFYRPILWFSQRFCDCGNHRTPNAQSHYWCN